MEADRLILEDTRGHSRGQGGQKFKTHKIEMGSAKEDLKKLTRFDLYLLGFLFVMVSVMIGMWYKYLRSLRCNSE